MITRQDFSIISLFSCLSEDYLESVAQRSAEIFLKSGDFLFHEGDVAAFYVLLEGSVELQKQILRKTHTLNAYHAGDFFGEVPLLLGSLTFAAVRAKTAGRAVRLDAQTFREIIRHSEECNAIVLKALLERVRILYRAVSDAQPLEVLIVGRSGDRLCAEMGRFLRSVRTPYRLLNGAGDSTDMVPAISSAASFPAVTVNNELVLNRPSKRELAKAIGLPTEPKHSSYEVVIVGAGPAGLAAAVYGASEGLRVAVIDRDAPGGQAGTSSRIENYLGFPGGVSGDQLSERAIKQASRFGAEILVTRDVEAVSRVANGFDVVLENNQHIAAHSVILANGVDWRRLSSGGIDAYLGQGVSYGSDMSQAQRVKGTELFIVGGGNSAGQAAKFFSNYAAHVTMLVRGKSLSTSMSQYLIEQISSTRNIAIETNTQVTHAEGSNWLEAITTQEDGGMERRRIANALFIMIGAEPRTQWLPPSVARNREGYIQTGEAVRSGWTLERAPFSLETSIPGMFAVGDVRCGSIKRVAAAVGEGSMSIAFVHQHIAWARSMSSDRSYTADLPTLPNKNMSGTAGATHPEVRSPVTQV